MDDVLFGDISLTLDSRLIGIVEIHRPPNNYFNTDVIRCLADAVHAAHDNGARAIVLCSEGKHFCAGTDFGSQDGPPQGSELYREAVRLFTGKVPIVAAIQGAAIGGGLGLACAADFRVACPEARLSANFAMLGTHHGFGLSVTLPGVVGNQASLNLLYTGRRISGAEALEIGLCDVIAEREQVRSCAENLAVEIASSAPLAVQAIRQTLRGDLAERVQRAGEHEAVEQERLKATYDNGEGLRAAAERRDPKFRGV